MREDTTQVVTVPDGTETPNRQTQRDRGTLTILSGPNQGAVVTLETEELVLGRGQEADLHIDDPGLSRRHSRLFRKGDEIFIEDMGSKNGTFVHGEIVDKPRALKNGDRIYLGRETVLNFSLQDAFEVATARRVYEMAVRDPLTQVYNRRYLEERLAGEFAYAARHGTYLTVLLVDVDHFKRVNDTLGHQAGDAVLRVLATALLRMVRVEDLLARYGGEEFVLVARGTDAKNAAIVGERIRKTVEALSLPWDGQIIRLTVSVGLATHGEEHVYGSADALVAAADRALYAAKDGGRNRVCSAQG